MDLETIRQILEKEMAGRRSHDYKDMGNKYSHGLRTARLTLALRRRLFPDRDDWDDILTVAAWFHDILNGEEQHEIRGAAYTRDLLKDLIPADKLETICFIISVHDDRRHSYDPLIELMQDADFLDHLGAYDIILTASYGITRKNETAEQLLEAFKRNITALEGNNGGEPSCATLHFDLTRLLCKQRLDFQKKFVQEYEWELLGSIEPVSE